MANIQISLNEDRVKEALGDDEVAMRRFRCLKECSNMGYSQSKIKHVKDFEKLAQELGETIEFLYDAVDRYKTRFSLDALRGDVKKKGDKLIIDEPRHKSDKVKKEGKKDKSSGVIKKKKKEEISREAVKHRKKDGGNVKKNNILRNEMPSSIKEQEDVNGANTEIVSQGGQEGMIKEILDTLKNWTGRNKMFEDSLETISDEQKRFHKEYGRLLNRMEIIKVRDKFSGLEDKLDSVIKKMRYLEQIPNGLSAVLNRRIKELEDDTMRQLASAGEMRRLLDPIPDLKSGIKAIDDNFFEYIIDKNIPEKLDSVERSFEILEGKLGLLNENQKATSETDSQEFLPSEDDEGSLVQLSEYCKKALDVLTLAARHHARNQEYTMKSEKIRKESVEEGENKALKDLIEKFSDLDTLFDSNKPNDKILVSFLRNKGLHRNEKLSKGEEIEINASNRESFELKAEFRGDEGTYTVKQSCFEFKNDIIRRAKLEMKKE